MATVATFAIRPDLRSERYYTALYAFAFFSSTQPLDVGCFAPLKRAYGRFVSDLARVGYNHIDKLDFLADYPRARDEAFKPQTIQTSPAATGITPFNLERVLSKLNISLRTPTPPASRPRSRSSQFTQKKRLDRNSPTKASFDARRSAKAAVK
jgi:hypothetical protein